jgi:4-phospho-D-threonate 3-dehydrogenase / 4-phospho-D-erythronate 3-dehydrogenase
MPVAQLTILADDLSGAADCGLQAARHGLRSVVSLGAPGSAAGPDAAVVAWDLDTRACRAGVAYERTLAAARDLPSGTRLYLKLDSTLRGNLGAAIDAGLDGTGAAVAIVAPAFPQLGRTTVAGRHRVAGETGSADLAGLLRRQSRHAVAHLSVEQIRAGAAAAVDELAGHGPWLIACDCEDDGDLDRLAVALLERPGGVVWAGSAGLAGALVRALVDSDGVPPARLPVASGPLLVVAGSPAPETAVQVAELMAGGSVGAVAVSAAPAQDELARAASAVGELLGAGRDALLHATSGADQDVARTLGEIARAAAALAAPGGLVLTGGETARSVCEALGIGAIELLEELEAGIPIGRAAPGGLPIVTKAGGFGGPGSLVHACATLHGGVPCPAP